MGLARGLVRVVGLEMGPKDGSKGWTGQGWADWGGAVRWRGRAVVGGGGGGGRRGWS